jgi:hypothetical protein
MSAHVTYRLFLLNFFILTAGPIQGESGSPRYPKTMELRCLYPEQHRIHDYELQHTVTILQQAIAAQEASAGIARRQKRG